MSERRSFRIARAWDAACFPFVNLAALLRFSLLPALILLPASYLIVRTIWFSQIPPVPSEAPVPYGVSVDHPAFIALDLCVAILSAVVGVRIHRAIIAGEWEGWTVFKFGRHQLAYLAAVLLFWAVTFLLEKASAPIAAHVLALLGDWGVTGSGDTAWAAIWRYQIAHWSTILVLAGFALWLLTRLALIFPDAALRGRISLGQSWTATSGNFWRLVVAEALLALAMVVTVGAFSVAAGLAFTPLASSLGLMEPTTSPAQLFDTLVLFDLLTLPMLAIVFAMCVAFFSYAYVDLIGHGDPARGTVRAVV